MLSDWLITRINDFLGLRPDSESAEYEIAMVLLDEVVNGAPEWRKWWQLSQLESVEFLIHFTYGDPAHGEAGSTKLRRAGKVLRVAGAREHPGFASRVGSSPSEQARDDLQSLIDIVRTARRLPSPPPMPPPPAVPPENLAMRAQNLGIYSSLLNIPELAEPELPDPPGPEDS
jgi:hypothetical protein